MNRKKRILFLSESHKLASGFGTYANEVLPRLHKTGKYELAEVACYSSPTAFENTDWLTYGVAPMDHEKEYAQQYQNPQVQWGIMRFGHAALDFKPDIVAAYRDPWMDAHLADSSLLPFFHWVWMPTVDSAPQKDEWVYNLFNRCDGLLAYSEYGIRTLEEQTNGKVKPVGCASPAIDPSLFNIIPNKGEHKKKFGLPEDSFIVGTVMRNQKRKMFPDLMRGFKEFLNAAPKEIAEKSYLYLHTSYPEKMGWELANLIHEFGLGSRVLCTYVCRVCGKYHVAQFKDALAHCEHCGNIAATPPGVSNGVPHEELVNIYNLMDLYVQYAICEGFGMPQVEAAACGTPIASIDYSAMEDVVRYTNGYQIEPKLSRELETNADRSGPNTERLVEVLLSCAKQSPDKAKMQRLKTRKGCVDRYTWDNTAKAWENYFDSVELGKKLPWNHPPMINNLPRFEEIPQDMNNLNYLEWLYNNFLQDQYHLYNYEMLNTLRDMTFGAKMSDKSLSKADKKSIYEGMKGRAELRAAFDHMRAGVLPANQDALEFIRQAHRRMKR
jgi:glycosyltransferase involved in cell wall biosynthesis